VICHHRGAPGTERSREDDVHPGFRDRRLRFRDHFLHLHTWAQIAIIATPVITIVGIVVGVLFSTHVIIFEPNPTPSPSTVQVSPTTTTTPVTPTSTTTQSSPATTTASNQASPTSVPQGDLVVPVLHAEWGIGNCSFGHDGGSLVFIAAVTVKNNDVSKPHSYSVSVMWGPPAAPLADATGSVDNVGPGQQGTSNFIDQNLSEVAQRTRVGQVPCQITEIVDEDGIRPVQP